MVHLLRSIVWFCYLPEISRKDKNIVEVHTAALVQVKNRVRSPEGRREHKEIVKIDPPVPIEISIQNNNLDVQRGQARSR